MALFFFGATSALAEQLELEGKATVSSDSKTAALFVEGTEFTMSGEAVETFVKQNGKGDFIVRVEGDFDVDGATVEASKVELIKTL